MNEFVKKLFGSDPWWGPLTLIMVLALCGFGWFAIAHKTSLDPAALVVGGLMAQLGTLINFRYGSSKKEKGDKENV